MKSILQILCILHLLLDVICQSDSPNKIKCIFDNKTRTFSTLLQYQANKISFDPQHSGYQGSSVNLKTSGIPRLSKNTFLSFGSESITKMDLSNNGIQSLDEGAFLELLCLHELDLSRNQISEITEGVFEGLSGNLQKLILSDNQLKTVPEIYSLSNLEILDLSHNEIQTLKHFSPLRNLKDLNLSYNKIRTIGREIFHNLTSLQILNLSNNSLIDINPENWIGLTSLQIMNLAGNYLKKFDTSYNFSFYQIKNLNLSKNYLTKINIQGIREHLPNLSILDITDNEWSCDNLEVIKTYIKDLKIDLVQPIKCKAISEGSWNPTEHPVTSTTNSPTGSTTTKRTTDYSKDILMQNGEILISNKNLQTKLQHLENLIVYVLVVILIFLTVDIATRLGICRNLLIVLTGRRNRDYLDASDVESVGLVRR